MARFIALDAVAFLLPFVIYWAWLSMSRRAPSDPRTWEAKVLVILSMVGSAIILITLATLVQLGPGGSDEPYHPAVVKDGKIVPGHFGQ